MIPRVRRSYVYASNVKKSENVTRVMFAAFSITLLGTGESAGEIAAEAVRVVRESGLPTGPMPCSRASCA
jgi:hypothetical protein